MQVNIHGEVKGTLLNRTISLSPFEIPRQGDLIWMDGNLVVVQIIWQYDEEAKGWTYVSI